MKTSPDVAVVVVEDDQAVRARLSMQLGDSVEAVHSPAAVVEALSGRPTVIVAGPSCADPAGIGGIGSLLSSHPEAAAVLLVRELSTEVLQLALRAGIKDVLADPVDAAQLGAAVERVASGLNGALPSPSGALSGVEADGHRGAMTTVFSTKGGAGKSVVAVNLAVALARKAAGPVVLVDADLQFGDIAVMLKLAPQHTIVDAVGAMDRLDQGLLQQLLVRHEPSGVFVLAAPLEPSFAEQISAAEMLKIVELIRGFAAHVVVDTPAYFNEVVLALIEESDDVLLVAGMDIPNIKNVKIGLQTLRLLNVPSSKLHLVLNRANSKVKLDVSEVERTLQIKADALVPSDIVVPQSVNKGVPVVLDAPKSGVARSLEQLAALVASSEHPMNRLR